MTTNTTTKPLYKIFNSDSSPCQEIGVFKTVKIFCKRDDLNHPIIQGNKLRKLKYNIGHALENKSQKIVTFGGAYSNHIAAIAQAAKLSGLSCLGFIRGDELKNNQRKWSQTLQEANRTGMELVFLSREDYRLKQHSKVAKLSLSKIKNYTIIPEGGSNSLALLGVAEIIEELAQQIKAPKYIITACGTGGTCAGLIDGVAQQGWDTKVIGIPVLKGAKFMQEDIQRLSQFHQRVDWQLYFDYHAGGYAKLTEKYILFGKEFSQKTNIPLDRIYNIKSFYAAYDLISKAEIKADSSVVILHTGGLQGGVIGI